MDEPCRYLAGTLDQSRTVHDCDTSPRRTPRYRRYLQPAFRNMNSNFRRKMERLFTPSWCMDSNNIGIVAEDNGRLSVSMAMSAHPARWACDLSDSSTSPHGTCSRIPGTGAWQRHGQNGHFRAGHHLHGCSLSPKRVDFYKKLGLDVLETERFVWRRDGHEYDNLEFIVDVNQILMRANPAEAKVVEDHLGLDVTPILVSTRCTQCLLLLSITRKKDDVTYYDVLYRSNPLCLLPAREILPKRCSRTMSASLPQIAVLSRMTVPVPKWKSSSRRVFTRVPCRSAGYRSRLFRNSAA